LQYYGIVQESSAEQTGRHSNVPSICPENVGLRVYFAPSIHLRRQICGICGGSVWVLNLRDELEPDPDYPRRGAA
jgi:hypothetical protein